MKDDDTKRHYLILADTVDRLSVPTGGVALIQSYWAQDKAENPDGTIILSSGDDTGATPPSCAFLGNKPAIDAMNGKRDGFERADFDACADTVALNRRRRWL